MTAKQWKEERCAMTYADISSVTGLDMAYIHRVVNNPIIAKQKQFLRITEAMGMPAELAIKEHKRLKVTQVLEA
jgi:hypothetical protein